MCNSCGLCSDGLAFILMVICNFGCLLAYIHRFYTYFWFAGYQAWFGRFHLLWPELTFNQSIANAIIAVLY